MEGGGNFSLVSFVKCFSGCRDQAQVSSFGTRIWNFTDKSIELQIRVGSILKKVHTLKPGSSKRLNFKKIYKAYMPGCDFSRMVKQQYISLEDLRDCSEIRIFRDHQRGCISVRKKPKTELC
ncbi:unnamed protein product [Withania somnifera]